MTSDDEAKKPSVATKVAAKRAAIGAREDHLVLPHVEAWRAWLDLNETESDGVWLVMAKKGVTDPTSIIYAEALDEALCSGWIDGQTFLQRYTPRRPASLWSQRNVGYVAELASAGRMRPRGFVEIDRETRAAAVTTGLRTEQGVGSEPVFAFENDVKGDRDHHDQCDRGDQP